MKVTVKYSSKELCEIIATASGCKPEDVHLSATHGSAPGEPDIAVTAEADTTMDTLAKAKRKWARKPEPKPASVSSKELVA